MRERNNTRKMNQERGVALIFALFALLLLSAIAASLVLMTNTETAVNFNYRNERSADYAAKAGFEEVRARMRPADPATINGLLPIAPPPAGNVLYVLNEGNQPGTVQPWSAGSPYMDDELCHDGYPYNGVMQGQGQNGLASDLRCTNVPNGNGWYATTTSNAPWSGTSAALPYKWVRVALKLNCTVQGAQNALAYCVNAALPATTQVCWNGSTEVLLPVGVANCQAMGPTVACPTCGSTNPVYVLTSLAVTGTSTRKMVQAEVALDPAQPFPYGLYATGNSCSPPALSLNGGGNSNPFTDGYNSANGAYGGNNVDPTAGSVGANGAILLQGHAAVGGTINVLSNAPSPPGPAIPCAGPTGDYSTSGGNAGPYNPGNAYPQNQVTQMLAPVTFPPPADPVPLPPNTPYGGGNTLVPGTYGAINATSTLTLSPGTYNIYSLTMTGKSSIIVSPPGAVVLHFPSTSASPINLAGQSYLSDTNIANDLLIQYGGTGTIKIAGQNNSYFNLDAPLATVNVSGKGDIFGRVIGQTLNWSGNGKFHFDKASSLGPPNNGPYKLISFRDVSY